MAYEAPAIRLLGTVAELTHWGVIDQLSLSPVINDTTTTTTTTTPGG